MANGTHEYKLGQLDQGVTDIKQRLKTIEIKVDGLNVWRWKTVGFAGTIAVIGNVLIQLVMKKL